MPVQRPSVDKHERLRKKKKKFARKIQLWFASQGGQATSMLMFGLK